MINTIKGMINTIFRMFFSGKMRKGEATEEDHTESFRSTEMSH